MEVLIALGGLIVGLGIGFYFGRNLLAKFNKEKQDTADRNADRVISEARTSASRLVTEAKSKVKFMIQDAERQNENTKQKKILEAKERYIKFKADFENEMAKRKQKIKDAETRVRESESRIKKQRTALQESQLNFKRWKQWFLLFMYVDLFL